MKNIFSIIIGKRYPNYISCEGCDITKTQCNLNLRCMRPL